MIYLLFKHLHHLVVIGCTVVIFIIPKIFTHMNQDINKCMYILNMFMA